MKRLPFLLACLLFPAAQAHDSVNAGSVQVTWHTDTNELLQVNADTTLSLALAVKGQPIRLSQCRCTLLLYPGEVSARVKPTILPLKQEENGELSALITTTQVGPYSVVLDGKPLTLTDFAPFRLTLKLSAVQDVYNAPKGK